MLNTTELCDTTGNPGDTDLPHLMKKLLALMLVIATSSVFAQPQIPFAELLWKGQAIPFYGRAANPFQSQLLDALKTNQQAERWARIINGSIRLKTNLGIGFNTCGQPNAFYNPQNGSITVCLELVEFIAELAKKDQAAMNLDRASFAKLFDGAIWGVLFHELAHAVIAIDGIAITGREEDVADQFAAYFAVNFIEPQNVPVILPTIWFFGSMAQSRDLSTIDQTALKALLSDEHSLDLQRVYNLACWAYGGNPQRGQEAVDAIGMPKERLARCPGEWATLSNGIHNRFKKVLKGSR